MLIMGPSLRIKCHRTDRFYFGYIKVLFLLLIKGLKGQNKSVISRTRAIESASAERFKKTAMNIHKSLMLGILRV